MPLPKPRTGENRDDFVGRCISFAVKDGMPQEQAVAACFSTWRASKQSMKNINVSYSVPIQIIESSNIEQGLNDTEFIIQGIAINSIITDNNHKFIPEELKKATGTLLNRPLLKDHKDTVDSIVGRVVKVDYDEIEQNIKFQARINNTDAGKRVRELIRAGDLNTVSVGAGVRELEEGDGFLIPKDIKFKELSLVATPADDDATFTFRGNTFDLALKSAWNKMQENLHCPECDEEFETKKELKKHMSDEHPNKMEQSNSEEISDLNSQSYSQKKSDLVTSDNKLNIRQEKQMVETEIKDETTPVEVKEAEVKEDISEKIQKEFEDFKSEILNELEGMKSTQKAQSELLSEALKGLKDLQEAVKVKEAEKVSEPKTEVETHQKPLVKSQVEPEKEQPEDEEEENDEDVVDEQSSYKVLSEHGLFTVVRKKYR